MNTFQVDQNWLAEFLPMGIVYPSSTVISGPAGSGKPILSTILSASWLRHGGTAIILLLSSDRDNTERLLKLYNFYADTSIHKIIFVNLNPNIDGFQKVSD